MPDEAAAADASTRLALPNASRALVSFPFSLSLSFSLTHLSVARIHIIPAIMAGSACLDEIMCECACMSQRRLRSDDPSKRGRERASGKMRQQQQQCCVSLAQPVCSISISSSSMEAERERWEREGGSRGSDRFPLHESAIEDDGLTERGAEDVWSKLIDGNMCVCAPAASLDGLSVCVCVCW